MTFFGQLTGKHYETAEARDYYEDQEALRRRKPSAEEEELAKLSSAELGEWIKQSYRSEEIKENVKRAQTVADLFLERHPEFVDCLHNGQQMHNYFHTRNISAPGPMDFNDAYNYLRAAGQLRLDENKIRVQRERERFDLADASEDELRSLPLDELRRRAAMHSL